MKKEDCKVGMRVGLVEDIDSAFYGEEEIYKIGTVQSFIGTTPNTIRSVSVKWDDNSSDEIEIRNLLTEEAARTKGSKIEKEFNEVSESINEQMKIAAKALRAANAYTDKYNVQLSMMEAATPLLKAMDDIGWNISSLSC